MTDNRDFIDFLIYLLNKKKIFFIILFVLISYATYFDRYKNTNFNYQTIIKIAPESVLVPIINNINVYNTSADVYLNPLRGTATYQSMVLDLCGMIKSSFVDKEFFYSLVDDFLERNIDSNFSRDELFLNLKGSIENLPNDGAVCVKVKFNSSAKIINYLYNYYPKIVNSYIENEIEKRLVVFRQGKLDFLEKSLDSTKTSVVDPDREGVLDQLELNALEERQLVVRSKMELVQNTELADTKINYFVYKSTNIGQTLNFLFLYAFAIFISIISFVLIVVLIDFKEQYKHRNLNNN
jgi:hypothetical protein